MISIEIISLPGAIRLVAAISVILGGFSSVCPRTGQGEGRLIQGLWAIISYFCRPSQARVNNAVRTILFVLGAITIGYPLVVAIIPLHRAYILASSQRSDISVFETVTNYLKWIFVSMSTASQKFYRVSISPIFVAAMSLLFFRKDLVWDIIANYPSNKLRYYGFPLLVILSFDLIAYRPVRIVRNVLIPIGMILAMVGSIASWTIEKSQFTRDFARAHGKALYIQDLGQIGRPLPPNTAFTTDSACKRIGPGRNMYAREDLTSFANLLRAAGRQSSSEGRPWWVFPQNSDHRKALLRVARTPEETGIRVCRVWDLDGREWAHRRKWPNYQAFGDHLFKRQLSTANANLLAILRQGTHSWGSNERTPRSGKNSAESIIEKKLRDRMVEVMTDRHRTKMETIRTALQGAGLDDASAAILAMAAYVSGKVRVSLSVRMVAKEPNTGESPSFQDVLDGIDQAHSYEFQIPTQNVPTPIVHWNERFAESEDPRFPSWIVTYSQAEVPEIAPSQYQYLPQIIKRLAIDPQLASQLKLTPMSDKTRRIFNKVMDNQMQRGRQSSFNLGDLYYEAETVSRHQSHADFRTSDISAGGSQRSPVPQGSPIAHAPRSVKEFSKMGKVFFNPEPSHSPFRATSSQRLPLEPILELTNLAEVERNRLVRAFETLTRGDERHSNEVRAREQEHNSSPGLPVRERERDRNSVTLRQAPTLYSNLPEGMAKMLNFTNFGVTDDGELVNLGVNFDRYMQIPDTPYSLFKERCERVCLKVLNKILSYFPTQPFFKGHRNMLHNLYHVSQLLPIVLRNLFIATFIRGMMWIVWPTPRLGQAIYESMKGAVVPLALFQKNGPVRLVVDSMPVRTASYFRALAFVINGILLPLIIASGVLIFWVHVNLKEKPYPEKIISSNAFLKYPILSALFIASTTYNLFPSLLGNTYYFWGVLAVATIWALLFTELWVSKHISTECAKAFGLDQMVVAIHAACEAISDKMRLCDLEYQRENDQQDATILNARRNAQQNAQEAEPAQMAVPVLLSDGRVSGDLVEKQAVRQRQAGLRRRAEQRDRAGLGRIANSLLAQRLTLDSARNTHYNPLNNSQDYSELLTARVPYEEIEALERLRQAAELES